MSRVSPSFHGAHNWQATAFDPVTRLVYLPTLELSAAYSDSGVTPAWRPTPGVLNPAVFPELGPDDEVEKGQLVAWDPVGQRAAWRIDVAGAWSHGPLATAGGLVFHGDLRGYLNAYSAVDGRKLWSAFTGVAISGAPISFSSKGRQYIAVLSAPPVGVASGFALRAGITWDYRVHPRRLLIYTLDGRGRLPPSKPPTPIAPLADPVHPADPVIASKGAGLYAVRCIICHGVGAASGGAAPDLRASAIPTSALAFQEVVAGGALESAGMPRFDELEPAEVEAIRHFIRRQAETALARATQR